MGRRLTRAAVCLALLAAGIAEATIVVPGPFGPGGSVNAYARNDANLTWDEARVAAYNSSFAGVPGHLATIASGGENALIDGLGGEMWIGLTDIATRRVLSTA
ncbi:MAG: hypothetical protein ACODAJ_02400 [Planctomycetota bacterium]